MGNLRSVQKAFEAIGVGAVISADHKVIKNADAIVLPGVGAFKDGMQNLKTLGLLSLLQDEVIVQQKPFLGICLGMQLIAAKSYEHGESEGLGWIDARVVKFEFPPQATGLKIPHVGWNNVRYTKEHALFGNIPDNSDFYFVHSYHFQTDEEVVIGKTDYGYDFISSISQGNIHAVQFHPEKSQTVGLRLLQNFLNL